jgi:hypothetical protein
MSDRGPDSVKEQIQVTLDHFLSDGWSNELSAVDTENLIVSSRAPRARREHDQRKYSGNVRAFARSGRT